jgi:ribonuclease HII
MTSAPESSGATLFGLVSEGSDAALSGLGRESGGPALSGTRESAQDEVMRRDRRKTPAKAPPLLRTKNRAPSLREERKLLRAGHRMVAAIDEVGRGALAGPVTVGVVVVDADTPSAPAGVRDSKLLTPEARAKIAPRLRRWAPMYAVGHASPHEIDRIGIIAALRLAACRALGSLPVRPDCALLDGSHNWLSLPVVSPRLDEPALFELDVVGSPDFAAGSGVAEVRAEIVPGTVVTQVKADLRCAAVAAASVLAKVERDALMVDLAQRFPEYGWHENKGYSAPEHISALRRLGPCDLHRVSWNLPGVGGESDPALFPGVIELDLSDNDTSTAVAVDLDDELAVEIDLTGADVPVR